MKKLYTILAAILITMSAQDKALGFNPNPNINTNTPSYQQNGNPYPQFQSLSQTQNLAKSLDRFNSIANSSEFQNVSIQSVMPEDEQEPVAEQTLSVDQPAMEQEPIQENQELAAEHVAAPEQPVLEHEAVAQEEPVAEKNVIEPVVQEHQAEQAVLVEHKDQAEHQEENASSPEVNLVQAAESSLHLEQAIQAENHDDQQAVEDHEQEQEQKEEHRALQEPAVHAAPVLEEPAVDIVSPVAVTEQIKIVKVYPVYDVVRSALHHVYNAGQDMVNYLYGLMSKEDKKAEVKTQCQM